MRKQDLRTGMKVVLNDDEEYIVLLGARHSYLEKYKDIIVEVDGDTWDALISYNENLENIHDDTSDFDIKKIYIPNHPTNILKSDILKKYSGWQLIWERKSKIKMTLEEIEEKLGFEIELI